MDDTASDKRGYRFAVVLRARMWILYGLVIGGDGSGVPGISATFLKVQCAMTSDFETRVIQISIPWTWTDLFHLATVS